MWKPTFARNSARVKNATKVQSLNNVTISIIIIFAFIISACSTVSSATNDLGKLNVVATTGQVADALANIGGEAINLTGLLGPGVDPHLYVPTESNVATFGAADLIVYNGLHLEAQMLRVFEQMETRGVAVLSVGDSLPVENLLSWDNQYPHDPHVWNDPQLWSQSIEILRDKLIELDPDNAELYTENSRAYLETLAETHAYAAEQLSKIPADRRVMITAHDAFGYFGRTYSLEVLGLQGISTESEASAADVQELVDLIVERQIPAIFVESSVSPKTIEAVQAAVEAQGFKVEIGGSLFSDALGEEGSGAETYVGMIRHNAETVANALGE
ncbi:zinc ABC transporter substrate-binding protein [Chloroflexi bacterium TSY]|nr:zinc ABC transporter substrate-binding protein [Chloroflexi bacterium TSY]